MSVQGNEGAYCEPRDDHGPYSQVEVGFPNKNIIEKKCNTKKMEDFLEILKN